MVFIHSIIPPAGEEHFLWDEDGVRQRRRVDGQTGVGSRCSLSRGDCFLCSGGISGVDALSGELSHRQMAQMGYFSLFLCCGCSYTPSVVTVVWLGLSTSPSLPWASDDRCLVTLATHMPQSSRWQSRLVVMPCEVTDGPSECAINGKWQARFSVFFLRKRFQGKNAESIFRTPTMSWPSALTCNKTSKEMFKKEHAWHSHRNYEMPLLDRY